MNWNNRFNVYSSESRKACAKIFSYFFSDKIFLLACALVVLDLLNIAKKTIINRGIYDNKVFKN